MQFSDITKAIHDAWTFSWPPLVLCVIVYLVAKHQNSESTAQFIQYTIANVKEYGKQIDSVKDILEPYGLTKLVPIVFAIAVIGFLYILNSPITILASKLPPNLSFNPDILMARSMPEEEKLVLLRKFPTANHFNAAYYMALSSFGNMSNSDKKNFAEINYKIDNFIKFSIICAVVISIFNIKYGSSVFGQVWKLVIILILLAPIWSFNFLQLLRSQEIQFHNEWNQVRIELLKDSSEILKSDMTDEEKQIIDRLQNEGSKRWWRLEFYNPHYLDWMKYTFFPK